MVTLQRRHHPPPVEAGAADERRDPARPSPRRAGDDRVDGGEGLRRPALARGSGDRAPRAGRNADPREVPGSIIVGWMRCITAVAGP